MQLGQLCPPGSAKCQRQLPVLAPHHPTVPHLEPLRASRQTLSSGSAPVQHRIHLPRKVLGQRGLPQPDISPLPITATGSTCALQTLREHNKNCLGNAGRCASRPHTFISWHAMVKPLGLGKLKLSPLNSCDVQVVGPGSLPLWSTLVLFPLPYAMSLV